jgi:hypothetical protein
MLPIVVPSPSPSPSAGPCSQGALASISDRPGIGRAPATNGAVCVVLPHTVVVETGYRDEVTTAGSIPQRLISWPNPIIRIGLPGQNELLLAPGFEFAHRIGDIGTSNLPPAAGMQDTGFGFKHLVYDGGQLQEAVNLFVTLPTGYPSGIAGFTYGLPTYTLGYSAVYALNDRLSVSSTQNLAITAAPTAQTTAQRFFMYQPSLTVSYSTSPNITALVEDQWSTPAAPTGGTGNRALIGLQCTISSRIVLDAEVELNLLPNTGLTQHAIGFGATILP